MRDKISGLVSIIVPVYRAAAYIADTIEMVLAQTYDRWELLLVDDCSGDGSVEAAEKAYIAFLDADDIWVADKLRKQLFFIKEKRAGFSFSAYEFGDGEARPTGRVVHVPETLTYKKALSRTVIFTTTVVFDRDIVPDELMRMPRVESEDTATWWQVLRAGYTAHGLDEVLAVYRRPAGSLSSNKLKAVKRIWNLYRRQEKLSVFASAFYFVFWAYRATMRRI